MGISRKCPIVTSYVSRTHEPCVPTCQVNFRMLMKRHDVSTFVIYAAWTTTYYPQGAAPKVACHWAMDFIPFREVSPMSISFRMVLLSTLYSLLTKESACARQVWKNQKKWDFQPAWGAFGFRGNMLYICIEKRRYSHSGGISFIFVRFFG